MYIYADICRFWSKPPNFTLIYYVLVLNIFSTFDCNFWSGASNAFRYARSKNIKSCRNIFSFKEIWICRQNFSGAMQRTFRCARNSFNKTKSYMEFYRQRIKLSSVFGQRNFKLQYGFFFRPCSEHFGPRNFPQPCFTQHSRSTSRRLSLHSAAASAACRLLSTTDFLKMWKNVEHGCDWETKCISKKQWGHAPWCKSKKLYAYKKHVFEGL